MSGGSTSRTRGAHVPAGRLLWALREDVRVVIDEDVVRLTVDLGGPAGLRQLRLHRPDPLVRAVLDRMTLGPVSLENVPGLEDAARDWRRGTGPCTAWRLVRAAFDQLGGCVVAALGASGDGGIDLLAVPTAAHAVFRLPPAPSAAVPVRLRPDAGLEPAPDAAGRLVSPTAPFVLELSSPRAHQVVAALFQGPCSADGLARRSGQPVEFVVDVLAYAAGVGLTTAAG